MVASRHDYSGTWRGLQRVYRRVGFGPEFRHLYTAGDEGIHTGWPPLALYADREGSAAAFRFTQGVWAEGGTDAEATLADRLGLPRDYLRGFTLGWQSRAEPDAALACATLVAEVESAADAMLVSAGYGDGLLAAVLMEAHVNSWAGTYPLPVGA